MQKFSLSPSSFFISLAKNKSLIFDLSKREILQKYRGSFFGIFWAFMIPILMLFIYTFVFSYIFQARWFSGSGVRIEFALQLFTGLIVFNFFSECVSKSPTLISSNANFVKKIIFPLEILPFINLISSLFHFLISLLTLLVAYIIFYGLPPISLLFMPIILIPLSLFTLGICWLVSSIGPFIRDISQLIGIVLTITMFMSPIFYPASALPENFQVLFLLNPLTSIIEMMRVIIFDGKLPDLFVFCISFITTSVIACCGYFFFQKLRSGFADVI